MTHDNTSVAVRQSQAPAQRNQMYSMVPTTFEQFVQFADTISRSNLCPSRYRNKPEDVMVAMQLGNELGLQPLQALQSIAVINGMPAIYGQGLIGIIMAAPVCEYIRVTYDEAINAGVCRAKRRGYPEEEVHTFSMEDAKKAKLAGKVGPWQEYPKMMCMWRALGIMAKVYFPDVSKGIIVGEEAMDYKVDLSKGDADDINERLRMEQARRAQDADAEAVEYVEVEEVKEAPPKPAPKPKAKKAAPKPKAKKADPEPESTPEPTPDPAPPAQPEPAPPAPAKKKQQATPENLIALFRRKGIDSATLADVFTALAAGVPSVMDLDEDGVRLVGARLAATGKALGNAVAMKDFVTQISKDGTPIGTEQELEDALTIFKADSE